MVKTLSIDLEGLDDDCLLAVRNLLRYSWADIDFQYEGLTHREKEAVGNAKVFERLVRWVKDNE